MDASSGTMMLYEKQNLAVIRRFANIHFNFSIRNFLEDRRTFENVIHYCKQAEKSENLPALAVQKQK
jgi:hypothetical protein